MSRVRKKKELGRPKGTGKYKEYTKPIRIPISIVCHVEKMLDNYKKNPFIYDDTYNLVFLFD